MNREFVFERDTGIMFQRVKMPEQPLKPKNNQFTIIPRLESVNAEEYNKQFEELIQSMPKNLAYSAKFGKEDIIPPGVSPRTPKHNAKPAEKFRTEEKEEPLKEIKKTVAKSPEPEKITPPPEPVKAEPKPEPKKTEPAPPVQNDEPIVFYTGYEQESSPLSEEFKNKEIIIEGGKKKPAGSFKERFVNTFHRLFATPAEDEFSNNDFE